MAREAYGLPFVALAVAFNAILLAPELLIGQVPLNDLVLHRAASERLAAAMREREPFMDPWVSEWALGYPLWKTYPPLAHLLGAFVLQAGKTFADPAALFAALHYGLMVMFPLTVYVGGRLMGLAPTASGMASVLVFMGSSAGALDGYGLNYGSFTWRGSGLYSQILALHLLVLAVAAVVRGLDDGRLRPAASLLLALTVLAHFIFGYVAFVSSAVLAVVGPWGRRAERMARLATIALPALALAAWTLVPMLLAAPFTNFSRWEPAWKWDSYGGTAILTDLLAGRLLDFGRPPVLTILGGVGSLAAVLSFRDPTARRLLALAGVWLTLFLGREAWGYLVVLAGIPDGFHLHRLAAAFQIFIVFLTSYGLTRAVGVAARRHHALGAFTGVAVVVGVVSVAEERARHLLENAAWGRANLAAVEAERVHVDDALRTVRAILAERPGRAAAGLAATWGSGFKVGFVPFYAFLSRDHLDQASFLFHSMSRTSESMVLRNEADPVHDAVFGIRAVVAPIDGPRPPHLRVVALHGRFFVYEASPEGYFGLADIGGHYTGPDSTLYEPSASWLASPLPASGIVLSLDPRFAVGRALRRWESMPDADSSHLRARGRVVREEKDGETYTAHVDLARPAYVVVKVTWMPDLAVAVDGKRADLIHVTPGFGAVAVPAGQHVVVVNYRPGPLKPFLLLLGVLAFSATAFASRSPTVIRFEAAAGTCFARLGQRFGTPRAAATAIVAAATLVALHPLFRGKLIDGHDATEYPPRLVEMARVLSEGHVPPVWAPDLGAGHGQPLFAFAPPAVYVAALPFNALGVRLAPSLQLGLAVLHALGAAAAYRLGRRLGGSRSAAAGGAVAWLFAPYLALDLFVRAAFAEATAVAMAPLALLGLLAALDRPTPVRAAVASIAIALVPLSHNAAALLLLPAFTLITVIFALGASRPARPAVLASGGAAVLLGLALSAYFWLPALLEKGFTHAGRLREGFLHWSEHAVEPAQLLWSPWGHGTSVAGAADGMSFALGPVHLVLGIAGGVVAICSSNWRRRALAIGFAGAALAGAWLSTTWSAPVWSRVETLQYLAYPWRSLLLPGLFLPLLAVFAFERAGRRATWALGGLLVVFNLSHTEAKGFLIFDDEYYDPAWIASKGMNTTTREEYEPRWVEQRPLYSADRLVGSRSPLAVTHVTRGASREELLVKVPSAMAVEWKTFYYPGWTLTVDGVPTPIAPVPVRGTIGFALRAGEHRLVLELKPTPVRRVGLIVTSVGSLALAAVALYAGARRGRSAGRKGKGL